MTSEERKSDAPCVEEFMSKCIDFKGSTSFHSVDSGKAFEAAEGPKSVLLLGSAAALSDVARLRASFPYFSDSMGLAIQHASEGSAQIASVSLTTRIFVGKVPNTASRHNCKARPDVVYSIVKEAIRAAKPHADDSVDIPLDIYYIGREYALAIAAAVARANYHHFSAKKGNTDNGYCAKLRTVRVVLEEFPANSPSLTAFAKVAEMVQLCQRLVDAPTNVLNSVTFAEIATGWTKRLAALGHNVSIDIIKGEALREQGYGGLYSTGKAAELPPHLITLSYTPTKESKERATFVGKGIVYDTGGLSLKSRDGMCTMKHDMGGAAGVFCSFLALAMLEAPVTLKCVLCVAENAIGPKAMRNDDIIRMKSGVTIEINNTDAEGRLVLSDGVFHATGVLPDKPNIVVDMATLTGAQGIATGKKHAAIFCNSDSGEDRFMKAGKQCGDLCFPIVYCPEFHNTEFKSEFADFRNSVKNRANAQASCAGQFIANNLAKDYKGDWVHVDLASPATADEATGFGVALLVQTFFPEPFSAHL